MNTPVLIVGAGPTGLVLALSLARQGIAFRIVSAANGPGEHSRAMVVQARTLEFYDQFGFADEVVSAGIKIETANLREQDKNGSHEVDTLTFADLGAGLSAYPFPLSYPQDDHEKFLVQKLQQLGVQVEWNKRLGKFVDGGHTVTATLEHGGQHEIVTAAYICGCDGARSVVRTTLALDFPGGTYEQLFYVADVQREPQPAELEICLGEKLFALVLPVRSSGMQRLIGIVPVEFSSRPDITFDDIRSHIEPLLGAPVKSVNWFATYRVHHRVAEHFRVGRAFLLGDAGHIHSPAGGQGMNTGIGDAVNLGWKLAQVLSKRAHESILDSYEAERIGFARNLVETTDRAFTSLVAPGFLGTAIRRFFVPTMFNAATKFSVARHAAFRVISQIRIHYHDSLLSVGKAGEVRGGDRLPWILFDDGNQAVDNFDALKSLDWQVHIYGNPSAQLTGACSDLNLPLHIFQYSKQCSDAGLERDALYLIRPDEHVALAASDNAEQELHEYVGRFGLRMNAPSGGATPAP
ncbi:MAG: FAD-dependent monooxygenase [Gemmatimonadota bacterium]|nr:FAD-dependent monooxygenase [Gemmatimonadota bacterium]